MPNTPRYFLCLGTRGSPITFMVFVALLPVAIASILNADRVLRDDK
jgi:hypothetical protein